MGKILKTVRLDPSTARLLTELSAAYESNESMALRQALRTAAPIILGREPRVIAAARPQEAGHADTPRA